MPDSVVPFRFRFVRRSLFTHTYVNGADQEIVGSFKSGSELVRVPGMKYFGLSVGSNGFHLCLLLIFLNTVYVSLLANIVTA